jgi:hypothetical protein
VRILVVGAGLIGRRHLKLVAASEECELAGVVEPAASARAALPDLDAPVFGSLADALGAVFGPGLGAIIATPNRFHRDHALACIGAGLPTLVEKPLADTLEDAQAMVAVAAASGVPLLVGHHRRHSPYVTVARDLIRAGTLGRIVAVTASILFYKPDGYFDSAPWRSGPGGGPILINLIHEVDLLRALCGEVESVHAMSSSAVRRFPVEDTAVVTMRFESGALATIALSDTAVCSRSWEHTARENPDYPHPRHGLLRDRRNGRFAEHPHHAAGDLRHHQVLVGAPANHLPDAGPAGSARPPAGQLLRCGPRDRAPAGHRTGRAGIPPRHPGDRRSGPDRFHRPPWRPAHRPGARWPVTRDPPRRRPPTSRLIGPNLP